MSVRSSPILTLVLPVFFPRLISTFVMSLATHLFFKAAIIFFIETVHQMTMQKLTYAKLSPESVAPLGFTVFYIMFYLFI